MGGNIIVARDRCMISVTGSQILCSDGTSYILSGGTLYGPGHVTSYQCGSITEAMLFVVGMHGGRMV